VSAEGGSVIPKSAGELRKWIAGGAPLDRK